MVRGKFPRMNRNHLFRLASFSSLGLVALLGACKLDVGTPEEQKKGSGSSTSKQSGGADAGDGHDHEPGAGAKNGSGAGPADGSGPGPGPAGDGGAGGGGGGGGGGAAAAAADGGAPADLPPPAKTEGALWKAAPEGTRIPLNSAGNEKCSFEVAYIVENPDAQDQPAQYTITLEKKDDSPGSCTESKGYVTLATHSYALPAGVVRRHATDEMIAVAWTEKAKADVDSQSIMHLAQIDWATGTDLHDGIMYLKGMTEAVPEQPLVPTSMNLSIGYDVILSGTGTFPGATGEGQSFEATWKDFLAAKAQAPSAADSATQQ